jgi:hypothetical protein
MKTMIIAAAAALSLAAGSAYADGGDVAANTQFTELPGVIAQAQVPNAPVYAQGGQATQQAQNGQEAHSTPSGHGPWLFPPLNKYLSGANG